MLLVGFYHTILTLSLRAFGPRISAYAFWTRTDIHTDRHTYIYHAKSRLNTPVWGSLRSPNNLLHLVIVKYGDISLVLSVATRLRLVTILSLLVKYLVILHADPCNKSYWRASEASETLSGLFNRESYIIIYYYGTYKFCFYNP